MSSAGGVPTGEDTINPSDEEFYASWGLCILCVLLIGALCTSYYLQVKRIRAIHETVVSIFAGMVVGLIIRLSPGHLIREMLTFKHTLFFNLLLPPIILNSGYELKQENFFRNFGVILTFAFLGTFISAVGIGVLVYIWSFLGLEGLKFSLLECLIFGSTLSATDPVTILAIFNQYKVDPKLYSTIFGESILNDAVSIVMYETLSRFHGEDIYLSSLFNGVGIFLFSFVGSMLLGVLFGLGCSLGLKHSHLASFPHIESCLVALVAYTSYFFSNGLSMSGIVSLLFCGITLKHYAYHTMSKRTQRTTKYMFAVLAQLSENFIFIYLGLNLFTQDVQVFKPLFILVSAIAVMASRYAAVFPLSELINWVYHKRGQRHEELPHSYQMMLFWAGLRGAVGVALAAGIEGENAAALRTTILVVVVLTVIVFGGTTARMLEVLGIRVGVEDEDASSDEDEGFGPPAHGYGHGRGLSLSMGGGRRFSKRGSTGAHGYEYGDDEVDDIDLSHDDYPGSGGHHAAFGSGYPRRSLKSGSASAGSGGRNMHLHASTVGGGGPERQYSQHSRSGFSTNSSESDDGEPLSAVSAPDGGRFGHGYGDRGDVDADHEASAGSAAGAGTAGEEGGRAGMIFKDGQWFTALDERYLLPLFSNSYTARQAAKRRAKKAQGPRDGRGSVGDSGYNTPRGGSMDVHRTNSGPGSADVTQGGGMGGEEWEEESENGKNKFPRTFSGSVSDFFFKSETSPNNASPTGGQDDRRGDPNRDRAGPSQ